MRSAACLWLVALIPACGYGPVLEAETDMGSSEEEGGQEAPESESGAGEDGGGEEAGAGESSGGESDTTSESSGGDESESSSGEESDTSSSDDGTVETSGDDESTDSGDSSDSGEEGGDGDSSDACGTAFVKLVVPVADSVVHEPMEVVQSGLGEGLFAASAIPEEGTVEFEVDFPCAATYLMWGRVVDHTPGIALADDPDSFYVSLDDGEEHSWFYGCSTVAQQGPWGWHPVTSGELGDTCDMAGGIGIEVAEPGIHTLSFRNREGMTNAGSFAGIARVLLVNDVSYHPGSGD